MKKYWRLPPPKRVLSLIQPSNVTPQSLILSESRKRFVSKDKAATGPARQSSVGAAAGFLAGYTLLVLVNAISIAYGLALMRHLYQQQDAHHDILQVQNLLDLTQVASIVQHRHLTITVNPRTNQLITPSRTLHLPATWQLGTLPGIKGPPSHPTTLVRSPCTFAGNHITLYPQGTSDAGTLYFIHTPTGQQYALTLSVQKMGLIRWYQWTNGSWSAITPP